MMELKTQLIKDLQDLFEGAIYGSPDGTPKKLKVFSYAPPRHDDGSSDADDFPFIAVRRSSMQRQGADSYEMITMRLIFGVYDDNTDYKGAETLGEIVRKVLDHYDVKPVLRGEFKCDFPRDYADTDEDMWPYFFGALDLVFMRLTPEEEDPYV